jgi:hypothetical protein
MGYVFEMEEGLMMLLPGLVSGIPSGLFSIAAYVLTAIAIYSISLRRGLSKPWLAWIPVVNCWLLGSLSDQYQYIVKGKNTSRRKWLLALNLIMAVLTLAVGILVTVAVAGAFIKGPGYGMGRAIAGPVIGILGLILPLAAAAVGIAVIRYMALYDVYRSLDPNNAVLFLVLSILFSPTEPFFLFFNREKDLGMPPRKRPADTPPEPIEVDFEYV